MKAQYLVVMGENLYFKAHASAYDFVSLDLTKTPEKAYLFESLEEATEKAKRYGGRVLLLSRELLEISQK